MQITTDYTGIGKIQYIAGERRIPILDSEYTDRVVLKLLVPFRKSEVSRMQLQKERTDEHSLNRIENATIL